MSEQKDHREGQSFPQGAFQELEEQTLEAVAGGIIEMPTPIGPNTYLYNSQSYGSRVGTRTGTVTLHTHDISIPEHTYVMRTAEHESTWQHVPVTRPDGTIEHTYHEILYPCPHCGG